MSVSPAGPPPVVRKITTNRLKVQMMPSIVTATDTDFSCGMRHVPELLAPVRAVDARRLVQVLRDRLHAAEQGDHHERDAQPDVDDDRRDVGPRQLRQPVGPVDPEVGEEQVQDAVLAVEDVAPARRR